MQIRRVSKDERYSCLGLGDAWFETRRVQVGYSRLANIHIDLG